MKDSIDSGEFQNRGFELYYLLNGLELYEEKQKCVELITRLAVIFATQTNYFGKYDLQSLDTIIKNDDIIFFGSLLIKILSSMVKNGSLVNI